jgi:glutathione S-transferase
VFKLYYAPDTCALAPHIALEEAGAPFEAILVDTPCGEQRTPAYLAINPKGRVPALVTPQGILTENPALLAFIAQTFPAAKLAPIDDPFAFARVQAFNSYLCSTVHPAHAHGRRGPRWADNPESWADMKQKVPGNMADCMGLIEREMLAGPWVMGDSYTIADPYLFTITLWLEADGVDITRFPKVEAHRQRVAERPAVKKVLGVEWPSGHPSLVLT